MSKMVMIGRVLLLSVLVAPFPVVAAPSPVDGDLQLDHFSLEGPRAFFVGGAESAVPVTEVEPEDNEDPFLCQAVMDMRCARSGETAVCINYVGDYCSDCHCESFEFEP